MGYVSMTYLAIICRHWRKKASILIYEISRHLYITKIEWSTKEHTLTHTHTHMYLCCVRICL